MSAVFIILALLGFAFVILIHELGHFVFAKWAGVRVEVFSIGFGPRLVGWKRGDTDYRIALLPLGGYVKMLGQEDLPENQEQVDQAPRDSYLAKSAWWRALILIGGVLFNFLSSYLILIALAAWGMPVVKPVVGEVAGETTTLNGERVPSAAARLGLRPGDEVLAVNGEKVRGFDDLQVAVLMSATKPLRFTVRRAGQVVELDGGGDVRPVYDSNIGAHVLGVQQAASNRIAEVAGAGADGPRAGERVVALDGQPLAAGTTGQDIQQRLGVAYGRPVRLGLAAADGSTREVAVTAGGQSGGHAFGLPVRIGRLFRGAPAEGAGVLPGDAVAAVDGVRVADVEHCLALVRSGLDRAGRVELTLVRAGAERVVTVPGMELAGRLRLGVELGPVAQGQLPLIPPGLDGGKGALAEAGLQPGDSILAIADGEPGKPRGVVAVRGGERVLVPLSPEAHRLAQVADRPGRVMRWLGNKGQASLYERLIGARVEACADAEGRPLGSPVAGAVVVRKSDGTPDTVDLSPLGAAAAPLIAALREGDWITAQALGPSGAPALEVVRGAGRDLLRLAVTPRPAGVAMDFAIETTPYRLDGPGEAFAIANRSTQVMIWRSLTFIPRFFRPAEQGGLDANKQLQGPIGIFSALKGTAEHFGFDSFLRLVALIGLNLVLVNLLPIPITDGGQLVILGVESVIRRPLPASLRNALAYAGLALVVALMLYVTSLDVMRRL
jgi:regulator of sigma E protease